MHQPETGSRPTIRDARSLCVLPGCARRRPRPLEIEAAEMAGHVDGFADAIEAWRALRLHRLRRQLGGIDAASGDLGFGEALGTRRLDRPVVEAARHFPKLTRR